jgi:hypothetical protein
MFRVSKELLYSWGAIGLNFGGFLFIIPMAKIYLTAEEFNFWLFTSTIVAFGMMIESSLTAPFVRVLTYAKTKKKILSKFISYQLGNYTSVVFTLLISVIPIFILTLTVVFYLGILSTEGAYAFETNEYIFIISITCALRIFLTFSIAILHSEGQIKYQTKVSFYNSLFRIISTVLILYVTKSLFAVLLINLIFIFIEFFVYLIRNWNVFVSSLNDRVLCKNVYKSSFLPITNTFVIRIGGFFIAQSTSILALKLPIEESTALLFTIKCITLIYRVCLMPLQVSIPAIVEYRAVQNNEAIKQQFIKIIRLSIFVYLSLSLSLISLSFFKFDIYGFKLDLLKPELMIFIVFIFILELHHVLHAMLYETTNDVPFVKISLASGALIYLFGYNTVMSYGVLGLLFSQFIVQLLGNNWFSVRLSLRSLQWPFLKYVHQILIRNQK